VSIAAGKIKFSALVLAFLARATLSSTNQDCFINFSFDTKDFAKAFLFLQLVFFLSFEKNLGLSS